MIIIKGERLTFKVKRAARANDHIISVYQTDLTTTPRSIVYDLFKETHNQYEGPLFDEWFSDLIEMYFDRGTTYVDSVIEEFLGDHGFCECTHCRQYVDCDELNSLDMCNACGHHE